MAGDKDAITCHVLDTAAGRPARGVRVRLEGGGGGTTSSPLRTFESQTDDDGRVKTWLPYSGAHSSGDVPTYTLDDVLQELHQGQGQGQDGTSGGNEESEEGSSSSLTTQTTTTWTLRFDTGAYFADQGVDTFFPEALVTFTVRRGQHYHVPLLLSPYQYTTYRGS
ncbi:hypothetical protein GGR56DRAFT_575132 [Xylariaceae sp. FL0804]|nr:hypothetical protein GGR56DRAFT_575132 [Xylariaceae sp. FL0804]